MKASLRLLMAVMALGTFGFGCEYYKYGNAQTLPLSQEQVQKMRGSEDAKDQAGSDDIIVPSGEAAEVSGNGTGGAASDEIIVPQGNGASAGDTGSGGTTGGTTGGEETRQTPVSTVDVDGCLSINSSSYFRCFYRDVNHSFCADLFGKRIGCPEGATPSCRSWNADNWYCRESGDGGCVDKTTLERVATCGAKDETPTASSGSTTGGTTGGTPVDPATCEPIETSTGPAGYSRCFSSTHPAPTSSGLCADASGREIACPDSAWVSCSPSNDSFHVRCSEENSDWCVRTSDFRVDTCPAAPTPTPPPAVSSQPLKAGDRDASFGVHGMAETDLSAYVDRAKWPQVRGVATASAVQSDGKIIVVGTVTATSGDISGSDAVIVRYCADGQLDDGTHCGPGFGAKKNGVVIADANGAALDGIPGKIYSSAQTVFIQGNGGNDKRIVVAGDVDNGIESVTFFLGLNLDGTLDTSFGTGYGCGVTTPGFRKDRYGLPGTNHAHAHALRSRADESFLVATEQDGDFRLFESAANGCTMPLHSNVSTLGARLDIQRGIDTPYAVAAHDYPYIEPKPFGLAQGQLPVNEPMEVVAGTTFGGLTAGSGDFALARYVDTNGFLDTTFGGSNTGYVTTDFGGQDIAKFEVIQNDGAIIAAGTTDSSQEWGYQGWHDVYPGDKNMNVAVARYDAQGRLDPTFGQGGKLTLDYGGLEEPVLLSRLDDEHLLLAGTSRRRMIAATSTAREFRQETDTFVLVTLDKFGTPVNQVAKTDLALQTVNGSASFLEGQVRKAVLVGVSAQGKFAVERRILSVP